MDLIRSRCLLRSIARGYRPLDDRATRSLVGSTKGKSQHSRVVLPDDGLFARGASPLRCVRLASGAASMSRVAGHETEPAATDTRRAVRCGADEACSLTQAGGPAPIMEEARSNGLTRRAICLVGMRIRRPVLAKIGEPDSRDRRRAPGSHGPARPMLRLFEQPRSQSLGFQERKPRI